MKKIAFRTAAAAIGNTASRKKSCFGDNRTGNSCFGMIKMFVFTGPGANY
jgi:hypothetical protein